SRQEVRSANSEPLSEVMLWKIVSKEVPYSFCKARIAWLTQAAVLLSMRRMMECLETLSIIVRRTFSFVFLSSTQSISQCPKTDLLLISSGRSSMLFPRIRLFVLVCVFRQHAIVELGGEDLQEGNRAILFAHPKVPALGKIKGCGCDVVFGGKAR
ncbi:hypothetical protein SAMN05421804_1091, partial [Proteiniclasticum ruminis]